MTRRWWTSMMAATVAVGVAGGLAVSAPAVAAPSATTSADVYFVHGYNAGDCAARWNAPITAFRNWGWKGRLHTVGYYAKDTNCSDHVSRTATYSTSIDTLGKELANYLYRNHSAKGQTVNLVGHSMGGLISRAAIAGVAARKAGFPPYLYVANVATMGTPHQGVSVKNWKTCGASDLQCRQMHGDYAKEFGFTKNLPHAPQAKGGTDWSLIGAGDDTVVSWSSAVDLRKRAQHKYHYLAGQGLGHSALRVAIAKNRTYKLSYWNTGMSKAKLTSKGWSPVYAAFRAVEDNKSW